MSSPVLLVDGDFDHRGRPAATRRTAALAGGVLDGDVHDVVARSVKGDFAFRMAGVGFEDLAALGCVEVVEAVHPEPARSAILLDNGLDERRGACRWRIGAV